MAGRSSKKNQATPQPKSFDDFDDETVGFDDDAAGIEPDDPSSIARSRDWRDVEKHRELRELRKLVGDDLEDMLDDLDTPVRKRRQ